MEQQAELKTGEEELSQDFMQKVAAWGKSGLFDRLAAKIDDALEELEVTEEVRKCTSCGRLQDDPDFSPYCGRCDKIEGDAQADLAAELRAGQG
jgi:hypothetical protein